MSLAGTALRLCRVMSVRATSQLVEHSLRASLTEQFCFRQVLMLAVYVWLVQRHAVFVASQPEIGRAVWTHATYNTL